MISVSNKCIKHKSERKNSSPNKNKHNEQKNLERIKKKIRIPKYYFSRNDRCRETSEEKEKEQKERENGETATEKGTKRKGKERNRNSKKETRTKRRGK